jgi:transcriptional regulator with XRE-family HTH domain
MAAQSAGTRKSGDAHISMVRIRLHGEALMSQALRPLTPHLSADAFIGARLRAHRLACGLAQAALGTEVLLSASAVHMIETGRRSLLPDQAARLDDRLGTRGELAALAQARQRGLLLNQEDRDMDANRRAFLHGLAGLPAIAAAGHIGQGMQAIFTGGLSRAGINAWEDTVTGYAARYTVTAPSPLLADMLPDLTAISRLTAAHPYQTDLASIAARMAGLTSALLTDLGEAGKARHWLAVLDGYAQQAGDTRTRIWGQAALAILETYYATPARVLALTSRSVPAASDFPCAGTVMLHGLRGRALAEQGDRPAAITALAAAARIHGQLGHGEAEDYMWGFPERQLRWYESRTFTMTGDLDRASQSRAEALRLYPGSDQVDRVLLHLDEAHCALAAGEPDRAAASAADTLKTVPPERRTAVVSRRAEELAQALAPYHTLNQVRDFNDIRTAWTRTS